MTNVEGAAKKPTATHDEDDTQDTDDSMARPGCEHSAIDHVLPSHDSINNPGPESDQVDPTATQKEEETQETPSNSSVLVLAFGLSTIDQRLPSQDTTKV